MTEDHATLDGLQAGGAIFGNGWDALASRHPSPLPRVSVVVAHFDQQAELDRTLLALSRQTYPAELMEIIVVDDGSPTVPVVPASVRLLTQDDRGFRLAAARNLGAAASTGDVLCFLDADTSPEPQYVAELTRMPALAPEVVAVGRRRHGDFDGVPLETPVEDAGPAHPLPEPHWLSRAYTDSDDLLRSDDRSYRFVIGAVIGCSRSFFDQVGGFDESFTNYGGEDWEWAYRAWLRGAVFAHIPAAIAWHDGPEWADRDDVDETVGRTSQKTRETRILADVIPLPGSAPFALASKRADIRVTVRSVVSDAAIIACVDSILRVIPTAHVVVADEAAELFAADPRVIAKSDAEAVDTAATRFDRVRIDIRMDRPIVMRGLFADIVTRFATDGIGVAELHHRGATVGTLEHARSIARRARWGRDDLLPRARYELTDAIDVSSSTSLAAYLGGWLA